MSGGTYPKRKIFINYRHHDHPDFVERIRDWFALRYGRDSVFMDFDTIPPFSRFADYIRNRVQECDVLIAIIGPRWLELLRERLDYPEDDYLRLEIVQAIHQGKPIAPICIKGASVPHPHELPPDMRAMLQYNVAYLDSGRAFLDNIEPIMDAVERQIADIEGLALITQDMQARDQFNIRLAIEQFEAAADAHDWFTALDWLTKIRASEFVPRFYPLDDYEREIREAIQLEKAQHEYNIIRMMAERARKKRQDSRRVWDALLTFWESYPDYDPDSLALEFCPEPAIRPDERPRLALDPLPELDVRIFDQLDSMNMEEAEVLFDPDTLEEIAEQRVDNPTLDDIQGQLPLPDELTS